VYLDGDDIVNMEKEKKPWFKIEMQQMRITGSGPWLLS
jgi:hypothetical protein